MKAVLNSLIKNKERYMFKLALAVNLISAIVIASLLRLIGESYNNPGKIMSFRTKRIVMFKALAIVFLIFAASLLFLILNINKGI